MCLISLKSRKFDAREIYMFYSTLVNFFKGEKIFFRIRLKVKENTAYSTTATKNELEQIDIYIIVL